LLSEVFSDTEFSFGGYINILEKMTAVTLLTYVWVMVDLKPPKHLQRSPKLKTSN